MAVWLLEMATQSSSMVINDTGSRSYLDLANDGSTDASPDGYSTTLSIPSALFRSTSKGLNLVVIANGKKVWKDISDQINAISGHGCPAQDQIDAVFVLEQDAEFLESSLSTSRVLDMTSTDSLMAEFGVYLQSPKNRGLPLLVVVASVDRIIDIIINGARPVQQLAFLGQNARKQAEYVRQWVTVGLVAVDFIYPFALPGKCCLFGHVYLMSDN